MGVEVELENNKLFIKVNGEDLIFTFYPNDPNKTRSNIEKYVKEHYRDYRFILKEIYEKITGIYQSDKIVKNQFIEEVKAEDQAIRNVIEFKAVIPIYAKPSIKITDEGELVNVDTEYKLFKAVREIGENPFILYDQDGFINPKRFKYSLKQLDEDVLNQLKDEVPKRVLKKLNAESLEKLYQQGFIYQPVPTLKNVDFLHNLDWDELVNEIINPGNVDMDERLKLIRKCTLPRGLKQGVNPHSIIVLPGQTGKSDWYDAVGIKEDKVSSNSLIGTATLDGIRPGSLDGAELPFCLDQIEESGSYLLFRYLLSFMESGSARVDMAAIPFTIRGSSILIITANPLGSPSNDFANLLRHLSKNPAMGRRFGIILYDYDYGDYRVKRIEKREHDLNELISGKLKIFRAVEEYARDELKKIIGDKKVWNWLNRKNNEWIKQAEKVIEQVKDDNEALYRLLLEFIYNGNAHTRGGALYGALVEYLKDIALGEYDVDNILSRAEEILYELMNINYESLKTIIQSFEEKKEDVIKMTFDTLPSYLKEIVSAVELFKREIKEIKQDIKTPFHIPLKNIEYTPSNTTYFSKILEHAKRGNPTKYNEKLKSYFDFEIMKDNDDLYAVIYSMKPNEGIKPLGSLPNFPNLPNFPKVNRKNISEKINNSPGNNGENWENGENGEKQGLFKCPYCGLFFATQEDLDKHLKTCGGVIQK